MKKLLNKIKPLDYKNSPIGSLKVEVMFHLSYLVLLSYISGSSFVFNKAYTNDIFEIPFEVVFLLMLLSWIRLSLKLNSFNKEKEEKKKLLRLKNNSEINRFNNLQNKLLNVTDGMDDYVYLSDWQIYHRCLLMLEKINNSSSNANYQDFKFILNIIKQLKSNLTKS